MKIMNALLKGSALSALAGMLALTAIPTTAAAQNRERAERPRFERQAPREARSFRPEASRPARQERSSQQRAAPVMTAPPQAQQVQARPQRTEQRQQAGNRGFALDPNAFQADGIHPNEQAQPIMFNNVWKALEPYRELLKTN